MNDFEDLQKFHCHSFQVVVTQESIEKDFFQTHQFAIQESAAKQSCLQPSIT
jgi:hypothetical protein